MPIICLLSSVSNPTYPIPFLIFLLFFWWWWWLYNTSVADLFHPKIWIGITVCVCVCVCVSLYWTLLAAVGNALLPFTQWQWGVCPMLCCCKAAWRMGCGEKVWQWTQCLVQCLVQTICIAANLCQGEKKKKKTAGGRGGGYAASRTKCWCCVSRLYRLECTVVCACTCRLLPKHHWHWAGGPCLFLSV